MFSQLWNNDSGEEEWEEYNSPEKRFNGEDDPERVAEDEHDAEDDEDRGQVDLAVAVAAVDVRTRADDGSEKNGGNGGYVNIWAEKINLTKHFRVQNRSIALNSSIRR